MCRGKGVQGTVFSHPSPQNPQPGIGGEVECLGMLHHQVPHCPAVCLQNNNYDCPLPEEETNPKGSSWLYHSDAIRTYLNLMGKSKKDATLEACAGALQNLTASKGLVRRLPLHLSSPLPAFPAKPVLPLPESLKCIWL